MLAPSVGPTRIGRVNTEATDFWHKLHPQRNRASQQMQLIDDVAIMTTDVQVKAPMPPSCKLKTRSIHAASSRTLPKYSSPTCVGSEQAANNRSKYAGESNNIAN
jgi:hypothetical protein